MLELRLAIAKAGHRLQKAVAGVVGWYVPQFNLETVMAVCINLMQ